MILEQILFFLFFINYMPTIKKLPEIVLESPNRFQKTISNFREVCPFPKYSVTQGVASKENKFTLCANTCMILGMNNGKSTYIGHFAPELKLSNFKQKLDYIVKKFKDETGHLNAIITGGYHYEIPNSIQSIKSFEQMVDAAEVLDHNDAFLTMICGKVNPKFTDNLAITKEKYILSHSKKIGGYVPTISLNSQASKIELEELLKNNYSVVELEPEQKICYLV